MSRPIEAVQLPLRKRPNLSLSLRSQLLEDSSVPGRVERLPHQRVLRKRAEVLHAGAGEGTPDVHCVLEAERLLHITHNWVQLVDKLPVCVLGSKQRLQRAASPVLVNDRTTHEVLRLRGGHKLVVAGTGCLDSRDHIVRPKCLTRSDEVHDLPAFIALVQEVENLLVALTLDDALAKGRVVDLSQHGCKPIPVVRVTRIERLERLCRDCLERPQLALHPEFQHRLGGRVRGQHGQGNRGEVGVCVERLTHDQTLRPGSRAAGNPLPCPTLLLVQRHRLRLVV